MQKLLRTIIDLVLPPKAEVRIAQSLTVESLTTIMHPKLAGDAKTISLFPYSDERIRALIKSIKFYGETSVLVPLSDVTGEYLLEMISERKLFSGWNTPLLIPIPASAKRARERGYNQTARIAESLARILGDSVVYEAGILKRNDRVSQVRIPRGERTKNVHGAFFIENQNRVQNREVILLDDVIESGATMNDARRALRSAGASDILGVAIAH